MRQLVIVSGAPGAGKSTLAGPLASALDLPLLAKDAIKETLFDALGHLDADALISSRRLGGAAMELLWRLAAACPAVVIEANFRTRSDRDRRRVLELTDRPVEVHCRVPAEVAAERYALRGQRDDHHPVHVSRSRPAADYLEFAEPFGIGPVIEIDTTRPLDMGEVTARVRQAFGSES